MKNKEAGAGEIDQSVSPDDFRVIDRPPHVFLIQASKGVSATTEWSNLESQRPLRNLHQILITCSGSLIRKVPFNSSSNV